MLKRFPFAFIAFIGLIVPAAFALALLAAPPASPAPLPLPGCDRNLADASTNVAAMQTRLKGLDAKEGKDVCTATRLYFLEVVKAHRVVGESFGNASTRSSCSVDVRCAGTRRRAGIGAGVDRSHARDTGRQRAARKRSGF